MVMSARQIGHGLPILSRWRIHDSQNRWWPHGTSARRGSRCATRHTSHCQSLQSRWRSRRRRQPQHQCLLQLTPRCGCDLCSAAIISRAATGRVGSRKLQLPLWVASCSVRGSPRPAVTLDLTWPRTFIMLHFATHAHDVPAFSSPAFSTPGNLVPCFPVLPFPPLRFGPTFSSPDFSSPAFSASPRNWRRAEDHRQSRRLKQSYIGNIGNILYRKWYETEVVSTHHWEKLELTLWLLV